MMIFGLIIYGVVIYGWAAFLEKFASIYHQVSYVAACAWMILVLYFAAYSDGLKVASLFLTVCGLTYAIWGPYISG